MSAVFRREGQEPIEASLLWTLEGQIDDITRWLDRDGNAEMVRDSVLDIGFNSRLGPGVAVQGETISASFMRRLAELEIQLWLSIYPPFDEPSESPPAK